MRGKRLVAFAFRLPQVVLVSEGFGLPAFSQMQGQPHLAEKPIQVVLAHLNRTKGHVPLPAFRALAGHRLDIFHDHIRQWKNGTKMLDDARFGFPSAPR
jgi:hypothetical protein